jgi:hypothetical protein
MAGINSNLEQLMREVFAPVSRSSNPLNFPFRRLSEEGLVSDMVVRKRVVKLCSEMRFTQSADILNCIRGTRELPPPKYKETKI